LLVDDELLRWDLEYLTPSINQNGQTAFDPLEISTSTKSASSNAGVKHNIHVMPSWMMNKAV
jgi:hypothetical protein